MSGREAREAVRADRRPRADAQRLVDRKDTTGLLQRVVQRLLRGSVEVVGVRGGSVARAHRSGRGRTRRRPPAPRGRRRGARQPRRSDATGPSRSSRRSSRCTRGTRRRSGRRRARGGTARRDPSTDRGPRHRCPGRPSHAGRTERRTRDRAGQRSSSRSPHDLVRRRRGQVEHVDAGREDVGEDVARLDDVPVGVEHRQPGTHRVRRSFVPRARRRAG